MDDRDSNSILMALTAAAREHHRVALETRLGERFTDGVCEVFSECGTHVVMLHGHNCMLVDDIVRCAPAPAPVDESA